MNQKIDPTALELLSRSLDTGAGLLGLAQYLHGAGFSLEIYSDGPAAVSDVATLRYADLALLPNFKEMLQRDDHNEVTFNHGSRGWQFLRCRVRWIEASGYTDTALDLNSAFDYCLTFNRFDLVEEAIRITWNQAPHAESVKKVWMLFEILETLLKEAWQVEAMRLEALLRSKQKKAKKPRRHRRKRRSCKAASYDRPQDLLRAEILQRLSRTT